MTAKKEDVKILVSLKIVPQWISLPQDTIEKILREKLTAQFELYSAKLGKALEKEANENIQEFFDELDEHTQLLDR